MERLSRFRSHIVLLLFMLVLVFYGYTMFDLQVIETDGQVDNTTTFTTYTRVKAARGNILDRNGKVLVSNRLTYTLIFSADSVRTKKFLTRQASDLRPKRTGIPLHLTG